MQTKCSERSVECRVSSGLGGVSRGRMRWRHTGLTVCLAVLLGVLPGAGPARGAADSERVLLDGVAAYVNGYVITVGEVLMVMEQDRRRMASAYAGKELKEKLQKGYAEALDMLVERRLVLDAYETGKGRIPEWAVDKRAQDAIQESFEGDRSALLDALTRENLTYEDWRTRLKQQLIVRMMREMSVEQHVTIPPDALAQYYEAHRDEFRTAERVNLRILVVRKGSTNEWAAAQAKIDAARGRIVGGEDFAAVTREVSSDSRAASGGDWGWVDPAVLRREVAEAIAGLEAGAVSPVVESATDFQVIKLEGREAGQVKTFAEAQPEIEQALRRERIEELYEAWVARLKDGAAVNLVEVNPF